MLKHVLLASAVLISTPALAQNKPTDPQNPPPPTDTTMPAPTTPAPATPPVETAPPQTAPAPTTAAPVTPAPADPATADTQPAPTTPAPIAPAPNAQAANPAPAAPATAEVAPAAPAPGAGIAAVVNAEFGTYDKNGDGKLSKTEFSGWMFALKQKADPAAKDDAANKAWTTQAFAQADSDKSKSVSKDELTNFLSQGQKAS